MHLHGKRILRVRGESKEMLTFATFIADMFLLSRVDDVVQRQLFLAFERFHANLREKSFKESHL